MAASSRREEQAMQIKIVTLDVRLSENTKRAIRWVVLPVAVLAGSMAIAHAYSTSWIAAGQPMSATTLKANLDEAQSRLAALEAATTPPGMIVAYGGKTAPTGWLVCDGSAVGRTGTYAALFANVGILWGGGDGVATFNIPDLRGYFLRGWDSASGRDPDSASRTNITGGTVLGDVVGSYQQDQFARHTHSTWASNDGANLSAGAYNYAGSQGSVTFSGTTGATGGTETRPVNAYVTYIIKF
jgi:microcystin-dependent protein